MFYTKVGPPGKIIVLFFLTLFAWSAVNSQDDKINSDKPDQSDGAHVLDGGQFQAEQSFYYNHFKEGPSARISSTLLRYGLLKRLELRLLAEQGAQRKRFMEETAQSGYPVALSWKLELLEENAHHPGLALISYLHLPITNSSGEPDCWSQAYLLVAEKKYEPFTLTINGGGQQEAFDYKWQWRLTGDLKYDLSDKISLFTEYFAQYADHRLPQHNMDGGLLYHMTKTLMLHAAAGGTVFYADHNYFVNAGFAVTVK